MMSLSLSLSETSFRSFLLFISSYGLLNAWLVESSRTNNSLSRFSIPIALIVDADGLGWSLVHDTDRTTSITRGDGGAWTVRFDDARTTDLAGIRVMTDVADRCIRFDARGVLMHDDKPSMRLELGDDHRRLDIGVVSGLVAIRSD